MMISESEYSQTISASLLGAYSYTLEHACHQCLVTFKCPDEVLSAVISLSLTKIMLFQSCFDTMARQT